jgi:hypothetical protein
MSRVCLDNKSEGPKKGMSMGEESLRSRNSGGTSLRRASVKAACGNAAENGGQKARNLWAD